MPVVWTDDLTVHVDDIDKQHQELYQRVNILLAAMQQGQGGEAMRATLDFLASYVVEHFRAEEEQMVISGFPHYEEHRLQHQAFLEDFHATVERISGAKKVPATEIVRFQKHLSQWLREHLESYDREFGQHLIASAH